MQIISGKSLILAVLLVSILAASLCHTAPPPKMRPYSGIGMLVLKMSSKKDSSEALNLYEEPGISRIGILDASKQPPFEWVFGKGSGQLLFIVMSRKGNWLRISFDEAGREAWLDPGRKGTFFTWETFLKGQAGRLLPGIRKQYYQLYQKPGKQPGGTATSKQMFKILKFEGEWVYALFEQNSLAWLRWRDDDGRLLISFELPAEPQSH